MRRAGYTERNVVLEALWLGLKTIQGKGTMKPSISPISLGAASYLICPSRLTKRQRQSKNDTVLCLQSVGFFLRIRE